jgi:hypothetical protein
MVAAQKKKNRTSRLRRSPQEEFDSKKPKDVPQNQQDLHLTVRPVVRRNDVRSGQRRRSVQTTGMHDKGRKLGRLTKDKAVIQPKREMAGGKVAKPKARPKVRTKGKVSIKCMLLLVIQTCGSTRLMTLKPRVKTIGQSHQTERE